MLRRSARHAVLPLVLLTALVAAILFPTQAPANVPYTQQVQAVGDRPVSGRYSVEFSNYYEAAYGYCGGDSCDYLGKRPVYGTLDTKLTTYRLSEKIKSYDYYLVDVDTLVKGRTGSSSYGWADIDVTTSGAHVVDTTETMSAKATSTSCDAVQLQLATPWPVLTASASVGSVEFCGKVGTFRRDTSPAGNRTKYAANRLARIKHLTVNRWVKVKAGNRPTFTVKVSWPTDKCTDWDGDWCQKYDDKSASKSYKIGTRG